MTLKETGSPVGHGHLDALALHSLLFLLQICGLPRGLDWPSPNLSGLPVHKAVSGILEVCCTEQNIPGAIKSIIGFDGDQF